jgi:hypothetical protein
MKNLFEQFANGGAEVSSKEFCIDGISVEFYGNLTIVKGGLSYNASYSSRLYRMSNIEHCICFDDWDIQDTSNWAFNGVPIDNIVDFKNTLKSSGLSSVAESLEVGYKAEEVQLAINIQKSKEFKKFYGKNAVLFNALTIDEKSILKLEYCVSNYDKLKPSNWCVSEFTNKVEQVGDEGSTRIVSVVPPLEVLQEKLNELKSK